MALPVLKLITLLSTDEVASISPSWLHLTANTQPIDIFQSFDIENPTLPRLQVSKHCDRPLPLLSYNLMELPLAHTSRLPSALQSIHLTSWSMRTLTFGFIYRTLDQQIMALCTVQPTSPHQTDSISRGRTLLRSEAHRVEDSIGLYSATLQIKINYMSSTVSFCVHELCPRILVDFSDSLVSVSLIKSTPPPSMVAILRPVGSKSIPSIYPNMKSKSASLYLLRLLLWHDFQGDFFTTVKSLHSMSW